MNSNLVQAADIDSNVSVTISNVDNSFGDCVELSISNSLNKDLYFAAWDVAKEEGLTKNLFKVFSMSNELYPYIGKMMKRSAPSLKELVKIPANGYLASRVLLAEYYNITGSIDKISYSAFVPIYVVDNGNVTLIGFEQLDSNELKNN